MKPNIIQFLSNVALSASLLFIPNLAQDLGANDAQIGMIVAVYAFFMFLSSYIFGRACDVYGRRLFISLGLALSTITFFLQIFTDPYFFAAPLLTDPWLLALVRGLVGFTLGIFPAALTAYVYDSARPLGKFSSFGALGWAVGTFAAGLIAFYYGVFIMSSLCLFLAFLVSLTMKKVEGTCLRIPFFPKDLLKKNWRVYLPYLLRHTGANTIWVIYPLYIVSLGGDKFWIGVIYTINTATQFLVMRFLDRFNSEKLLETGLLLAVATFFSFTLAQNFTHLFPMQVILACSWSCMYVGSLLYLMKNNVEKATSSGILNSVINISQVFGSLLGGTIALLFGDFRATMYVATLLTVVGFIFFQIGNRKTTIIKP
jgi:MFS family permease